MAPSQQAPSPILLLASARDSSHPDLLDGRGFTAPLIIQQGAA